MYAKCMYHMYTTSDKTFLRRRMARAVKGPQRICGYDVVRHHMLRVCFWNVGTGVCDCNVCSICTYKFPKGLSV